MSDRTCRSFSSLPIVASFLCFIICLGFEGIAHAGAPADPTGTWLVKDGDARIRIEHCPKPHDKICGYIVWTKDGNPNDHDDKNPDATKHSRAILGMQILLGLEVDGQAYSGMIYNAENGKSYDAHITLEDPSHLVLKGCVLKYLCQSQAWTKVDDIATGQLTAATDNPNGPRADVEWTQAKALSVRKPKR